MFFSQASSGPGLWAAVEHAALIATIVAALLMWLSYRRKRETRRIEPVPLPVEGEIKVTPKGKRFSADLCDSRHTEINRRLGDHDVQIDKLWFTLRDEDAKTRAMLEKAVRDFDRTIGEIGGTLKETNALTQKLLDKQLRA
jgi:hypothetical protein